MEDALKAFAAGEFLVVMDDENRENEGDLILAASHSTTEKMAWMIKHTRYVHTLAPRRSEFLVTTNYVLHIVVMSASRFQEAG